MQSSPWGRRYPPPTKLIISTWSPALTIVSSYLARGTIWWLISTATRVRRMFRRSSRAVSGRSASCGYGSPLSVIEVAMESSIFEPLPWCGEAARAQPQKSRRRLPYAGITRIRFKGFSRRISVHITHTPSPIGLYDQAGEVVKNARVARGLRRRRFGAGDLPDSTRDRDRNESGVRAVGVAETDGRRLRADHGAPRRELHRDRAGAGVGR